MKRSKLSTFVFYTLIVLMILFVVSTYLSSGLVAKYLSTDSVTDSARVAKWDIDFGVGSELHSVIQSTHLESGSSGNWGLDIANNSEVAAKFADSSNVTIRLYSPNFNLEHHHDSWDFLEDNSHNPLDNPIRFQVYLYNCSLDDLSKNTHQEKLVFDTNTSDLEFKTIIEDGVLYYDAIVDFASLNLGSDFELAISTGKASLKVLWSVEGENNQADVLNDFTSYHLIKKSEFNTSKYLGILNKDTKEKIKIKDSTMTTDEINETLNNNALAVDTNDYVIAYKEYDYFGYYIYTATFDGDLRVTVNDELKKYSDLDELEKEAIKNRTIGSDGSKLYVEALQLEQYGSFIDAKNGYEQDNLYLLLGLECRIMLNLKVEQID